MTTSDVELFQFIGKDNIPFHTVIFPSSLLGSGKKWTMLHHMSSTEYLNYEAGKFSKSKGVGVFGTDAMESGIPADLWRFYIFYNRPGRGDTTFTWADFQEKVNGELIGNLGNLANRTLTFVTRYFGGSVPQPSGEPKDPAFRDKAREIRQRATAHLEGRVPRRLPRRLRAFRPGKQAIPGERAMEDEDERPRGRGRPDRRTLLPSPRSRDTDPPLHASRRDQVGFLFWRDYRSRRAFLVRSRRFERLDVGLEP